MCLMPKTIDRICTRLGHLLVNAVDEDVLDDFRIARIKDGVSVTTVNRDMETIRRMLGKAKRKGWVKKLLDFSELHHKSLEQRRTVTVTDKEFGLIATAARMQQKQSPRLYALICTLYDSGSRPSELYPVNDFRADYSDETVEHKYRPIRWRDLFDENGQIVPVSEITSMKGKLIETRFLIVTDRMADAFRELWAFLKASKNVTPPHAAELGNLVFPHTTYQSGWEIVRNAAKVPNLRLRDLRKDWTTRLAKLNYNDRLAQHAAGHKRMQQTFEYTVFDYEAALQAKEAIDAHSRIIESKAVN